MSDANEPPTTPSTAAALLPDGAMEGRVVVVTGGGTGLGLEISRGFAALGANVIVPSRSPENQEAFLDEARARGWSAAGYQLVREPSDVRRFAEWVATSTVPRTSS